jgi:hypothetical protein
VMYEGYTKDALSSFESLGEKCPEHYNPSDFVITLVNNDFNKDIDLNKYKKNFLEWRDSNVDKQGEEGDEAKRGEARRSTTGNAVA